nr:MAG TPA: Terminase small subunit [Caudoviricetes sp.]
MGTLTAKQKRFVQEWMVDLCGTRAAVRAGYSEKSAANTASRLMKDPDVQAYRNELLKAKFDELGITRHSLAVEVYEMMQKCKGGTPHMVWNSETKTYEPDGTWEQNEKGLYKGAELLSRLLDKMDGAAEDEGADYETMLTGGGREF